MREGNAILITQALDLAVRVLKESYWVPVEEQLPEQFMESTGFLCSDCVLITNRQVMTMAYLVNGKFRHSNMGLIGDPVEFEITHWRPLPELPSYAEPTAAEIRVRDDNMVSTEIDPTLLECPHCGEKSVIGAHIRRGVRVMFFAICSGCHAKTAAYPTKEEAAAAWNRRYSPNMEKGG